MDAQIIEGQVMEGLTTEGQVMDAQIIEVAMAAQTIEEPNMVDPITEGVRCAMQ
jgi:hypothetical protein